MVVLVNGDSNSFGSEVMGDLDWHNPLSPSYAYGSLVSRHFNADEYVNIAFPGASNYDITFNTINWIQKNCIELQKYKIADLLVLIGWTEGGRYRLPKADFTLSEFLAKHYIADIYTKTVPLPSGIKKIDPTKELSRIFLEHFFGQRDDILSQIFSMTYLDIFLQNLHVKYFTFPSLIIRNLEKYQSLLTILSQKNNYIVEDKNFSMTSNFSGYQAAGFHLNRFGHIRFGYWIINQLKKRNII